MLFLLANASSRLAILVSCRAFATSATSSSWSSTAEDTHKFQAKETGGMSKSRHRKERMVGSLSEWGDISNKRCKKLLVHAISVSPSSAALRGFKQGTESHSSRYLNGSGKREMQAQTTPRYLQADSLRACRPVSQMQRALAGAPRPPALPPGVRAGSGGGTGMPMAWIVVCIVVYNSQVRVWRGWTGERLDQLRRRATGYRRVRVRGPRPLWRTMPKGHTLLASQTPGKVNGPPLPPHDLYTRAGF